MTDNVALEMSKTEAVLNSIIEAVSRQAEGKCSVDVLGCLLVLRDQLERLDIAIDC